MPYQKVYKNKHVEAKGVHYANNNAPKENREFYIGLGKGDGKSSGCCAGCTVEFGVLAKRSDEAQRIIVHRTADYPENSPVAEMYRPSPSLTNDEKKNFFYNSDGKMSFPMMGGIKIGDILSDNIITLKQENKGLQDQVSTLVTEKQSVIDKNKELQNQVSELERKVKSQGAENEELIDNLKAEIDKERAQRNKLQEQLTANRITKTLAKKEEKNEQPDLETLRTLQDENAQLKEQKKNLNRDKNELQKNNKKLTNTNIALQTDLVKEQSTVATLTKDKETLEKKVEALNSTSSILEARAKKANTENTELKNEIEKKKKIISTTHDMLLKNKTAYDKDKKNPDFLMTCLLKYYKDDIHVIMEALQQKQQGVVAIQMQPLEQVVDPLVGTPSPNNTVQDEHSSLNTQHLTRTEKENIAHIVPQGELNEKGKYNLSERLAAVNDNQGLLDKLDREAVITANISFKAIDAKKSVEAEKTGTVEIRGEHNHSTDHADNTKALIAEIQAGTIDKNTVIAIERKQYGENQGIKDIIKIANILEHNKKNPDNPLKFPEKLENTLIFQDALLYKAAKENGIKVISIEGRNLEHTRGSALYNDNREQYMTDVINEVRSKGYNVIANVGSSHKENLEKALENQQKHETGFSNIPRKLRQEALNAAASLSKEAVRVASVNKNDTLRQQPLTNTQPKKSAQGIG